MTVVLKKENLKEEELQEVTEEFENLLSSHPATSRKLYFNFFATLSQQAWDFAEEVINQQKENLCDANPEDESCEKECEGEDCTQEEEEEEEDEKEEEKKKPTYWFNFLEANANYLKFQVARGADYLWNDEELCSRLFVMLFKEDNEDYPTAQQASTELTSRYFGQSAC